LAAEETDQCFFYNRQLDSDNYDDLLSVEQNDMLGVLDAICFYI
jgi:hypothetical protein